MKQTIIFSMIFFFTFAVGFSAEFTVKDAKSGSPEKNLIAAQGGSKVDFQLEQDYTYDDIQGSVNYISEIKDYSANNLELEKTDSPENKESEEARSDMIAGAMGIGIF